MQLKYKIGKKKKKKKSGYTIVGEEGTLPIKGRCL